MAKTNTKTNTYEEEILKEIKRNEEYVEVKLFKDNEKYTDDVYVAVGSKNCVIKRGVPVKIKRKFYLALMASSEQDQRASQLMENASKGGKA